MKNVTEFQGKVIRHVYFVQIDFDSGEFLANTGDRNLTQTIGGSEKLFLAVGYLGTIGQYSTKEGTEATSLKFTLSGIPANLAANVAAEATRNKEVKVYIALFDENYTQLTDLIPWFAGRIDSLTLSLGSNMSVSASATSRLLSWNKAVNSRYTNEDQLQKYPGDKGLEFIAKVPTLKLQWGS